jgi:glycosyltransferase involved in cell wall biosynthesis
MYKRQDLTFAVIIATYNKPELLRQALESVFAQSRAADEIIVVDDGSSNDTDQVVQNYLPNVLLLRQQNLGQSIARNTGISVAKSEWICFLDHDDMWHRDKLAAVERFLIEHPGCRALHHLVWNFSPPGERLAEWGGRADFIASTLSDCHEASARASPSEDLSRLNIFGHSYEALLENSVTRTSAVVLHRTAVIRAGCFPPGHVEDWKLFRNVARFDEWYLLNKYLSFVRIHGGQTTQSETSSVYFLASYVDAWFGGRPLPDRHIELSELRSRLISHGSSYRKIVQSSYWDSISRRDWAAASLCRRLGSILLPRRRDRMYALLPRRITGDRSPV